MSNPIYIKVTVTAKEAADIDNAIERGYGMNRADLCRLAMTAYIKKVA